MTEKFDPEFDAIRAALVSKPELTKNLNVSLRNVLRLTEHLKNSGLRMERHGRWIGYDGDSWKCSICGVENCYAYDLNVNRFTDNYCPNCGVKMDGGDGK